MHYNFVVLKKPLNYKKKRRKKIENHYLETYKDKANNIVVSSSDGVFSSIATFKDKEGYDAYCEEKADEWLNSEFGNYDNFNKEERKVIAEKWIKAKEIPLGEHKFYFNLKGKKEIFLEEVANLAKELGIEKYNL